MINQTLGHYRILEKLGEGGMGVVYKAHDLHLDRDVAIKVLPPEKTADADRTRRFIQEARAASALNHPAIVTVHDVANEGGVDYIVMECIVGKTLGELIGRKGMKLNDLLVCGAQIADALAVAHAAGIVHRDLKPGNVMVTDSGRVKVLDFGLAKLTEAAVDESAMTATAKPRTEEGTIVGTVSYMSPEQAEGKRVDARSDIFSFGSVLYEMATGRRAFSGETKLATLSAILQQEPAAIEDAPPELEKIIARCLRKDPARRIQHMVDVKLAIEDLKEESDSGKLQAAVPRRRPRGSPWAVAATAVTVLALAAAAFWWLLPPPQLGAPILTQLTTDGGLTTDPALSPDGKLLAYASDRAGKGNFDIWIRQIGGGDPIQLTKDPANEREPSFSPDGTTVVFRSDKDGGGIFIVSALGGETPPRQIAQAPDGYRPRFSPDGGQVVYGTGAMGLNDAAFGVSDFSRIFVVPTTGGAPRRVRPDFMGVMYPAWAPDGQHLLFLGRKDDKQSVEEGLDWWVTPLDQGLAIATGVLKATRQQQLSGHSITYPWALVPFAWEARGNWLLFSARSGDSRNLWRIRISPRTWTATGVPERLTSSSAIDQSPSVASSVAGTVTVAFASRGEKSDIWSLPIDANAGTVTGGGEPRQLTRDAARNFYASLWRGGSKIVFISTRSGHSEVWTQDLVTGRETQLTASRTDKCCPGFSPDGKTVSFSTSQADNYRHYLVSTAGGAVELVGEDGGQAHGWSPDSKYVIGNSLDGRLILIDVTARRMSSLLAIKGRWFYGVGFSPDGRSIWFWEMMNKNPRGLQAPFQATAMAPESAWSAWAVPAGILSPDGTMLYDVSARDGFNCIWAQRVDRVTQRPLGDPRPVFHSHAGPRTAIAGVEIGPDRMIFTLAETTSNIWMATWKSGW